MKFIQVLQSYRFEKIQVSILESGWKVFLEIPIYIKDNSREEREHCGFRGENTGEKNYFC